MPACPLLLSRLGALLIGAAAVAPASANFILVSHTRSIVATSDSNFLPPATSTEATVLAGAFNANTGVTGSWAAMTSSITPLGFSLQSLSNTFLDGNAMPWVQDGNDLVPGFVASEVSVFFQVTFLVSELTNIAITGYRDRGLWGDWDTALTGPGGALPLVWSGPGGLPDPWNNYLDTQLALTPGSYTFTGETQLGIVMWSGSHFDGSHVRLDLDLRAARVPEGGWSAAWLGAVTAALLLVRARPRPTRRV